MDFKLTEAQQDLAGLAKQILGDWSDKNDNSGRSASGLRDAPGFDADLWRTLAGAGLLDAALPKSVGGSGFDVLEQASVLIEIGRSLAPAPYSSSIAVGASAIAEFGDDSLIGRYVAPVLRGDATIAVSVDDGTTGPAPLRCTETDAGWTVSGSRTNVTAGAFATTFLLEATTADGPVLVLIDRAAAGLTTTTQRLVDADDAALLELDDVAAVVLSRKDGVQWVRRRATLAWCAWQLGVLEKALALTAEYARTRRQFDKPIGSFQAVRTRLADAYIDVEAVRLTLWQAAAREAAGLPAGQEIATAKFWAAEAGHRVAHTAVHIHGGVGIDTDGPMNRYFVAAKRAEFSLGGATAQLRVLGTLLAPPPA
ncbi:acyl-CoA dehydrogenase family protein [Nocardia sp. NPDC101769]|uniref:acyl-CoA dehydrogenase family protein n=1 Tax=Nocardia sp. NPDC101769 TaxID=3364333 RepID=UPI00381E0F29